MRGVQIQKAKFQRMVQANGKEYTFLRNQVDEYGEPTGEVSTVTTAMGLWHESQGYVTLVSGDASTVRSKPSPQILVVAEDAKPIQQGDFVEEGGQRYLVTGKHDPTNLGIAVDVSLEVVV